MSFWKELLSRAKNRPEGGAEEAMSEKDKKMMEMGDTGDGDKEEPKEDTPNVSQEEDKEGE